MSLRSYLITMILATLLAGGAFVWTLVTIDPVQTGVFGFLLFYAVLILFLFGFFSVVGFTVRFLFHRSTLPYRHVTVAFRQAALYAALVAGMLWLKTHGLLTWWNAIVLVLSLTFLEFVALSMRRQPPHIE